MQIIQELLRSLFGLLILLLLQQLVIFTAKALIKVLLEGPEASQQDDRANRSILRASGGDRVREEAV